MAVCESCGNECTMPFTCQYCGGKFCPECRLPPNHQCTGLISWQKKPVPGVGMRYGRGRGVTATTGGYAESRSAAKATGGREIPWLKIMIAIILIVILIIFYLVMSGFTL